MTPDLVFRDPYLLDFLGLEDTYSERDLEAAILRELERFLLELWHRLLLHHPPEAHDYWRQGLLPGPGSIYHRSLHRLVAIELKLGCFDAAYKGQMELYLPGWTGTSAGRERSRPLALFLCGEKNREQIELLQLDRGEIRVAEYLVELPPKGLLEAKLHEAIRLAKGQVKQGGM